MCLASGTIVPITWILGVFRLMQGTDCVSVVIAVTAAMLRITEQYVRVSEIAYRTVTTFCAHESTLTPAETTVRV